MATKVLTKRQQQVYDYIRKMILERGFGPTVREIADEVGIRNPTGVMCHLIALEKKGFITREPNKSRATQLTENPITEILQLNQQLLRDWRAGRIQVNRKSSKAKSDRIADTFDALKKQIRAIK